MKTTDRRKISAPAAVALAALLIQGCCDHCAACRRALAPAAADS